MSIVAYFKYYLKSKTKYQIHSPFVFEFMQEVLEDKRNYYYFKTIKHFIRRITSDNTPINDRKTGLDTTVRQIASGHHLSPSIGQLLFKTINHYQPTIALEFGTGLGLNTLYQCTPSTKTQFHSFESSEALAQVAKENFHILGIQHVQVHSGPIEENVKSLLSTLTPDYLFINCDLSPSFLKTLLKKCDPKSTIIINKPYTKGSTQWNWLCQQEAITLSLDVYDIGIAFKRVEQKEKTHFSLIKNSKKPWAIFW